MNANELRIGNHIYIWYLGTHNERVLNIDDLGEILENNNHDYKPLPLTAEWLLKFGFDCEYYGGQGNAGITAIKETKLNLPHKNTFELYQYSGSNDWVFTKFVNYNTKIKYVHQLQNLYFALTGEELTIKP